MTTRTLSAFTNEFVKISVLGQAINLAAAHGSKLKIPAAVLAGAGLLHTGQKTKRRYDIGKAYEEQMEARRGNE